MEKIKFYLARGNKKLKNEVLSCTKTNEKIAFFVDGIKLSIFFSNELIFIRETNEDILTIKNDDVSFALKKHHFNTRIPVDKLKILKKNNTITIEYKFTDDEEVYIKIEFID